MRICFVAPANSFHTVKWCEWFISRGHEVHVISFIEGEISGAEVHWIDTGANAKSTDMAKVKYLFQAKRVKKLIKRINPDIVNAHYASSYGAVMAMTGIKEYIVSVWGADVYDFPQKSVLHNLLIRFSLKRAKYIFSTSRAMAKETKKYTHKSIEITPFGVDMDLFSSKNRDRNDDLFVIGTIKTLEPKYGIDYLVRAVAIIKEEEPDIPLVVRIAGKGSCESEYKQLTIDLGIGEIVTWLGFISQSEVAYEWANMDVGIVYSTLDSESFGVSAVECQASSVPVIISDIPGLMEATMPGVTSMVVKRCDERLLAKAIKSLYVDKKKRESLALQGRSYVEKMYELNKCFRKVETLYYDIIEKRK